jgi:hypothetical protein
MKTSTHIGLRVNGAMQRMIAYRGRRSSRVIAVLDNDSRVRHEISDVLSASGYDVLVFHSAESLVASNALHTVGILILGSLRCGFAACEPLRWASVEHADLATLIISKGRILACSLGTIFNAGSIEVEHGSAPSDRLESLFGFLRIRSNALRGQTLVALGNEI